MKITVAIPSYNKEKYISRCIESALIEKDYIEKIILVDNHSTDTTLDISKKYEPEITCYQNKSNLGMAKNWDRCIDLCDTEWLMILHADDELLPGAIQHYVNFIKKYPSVGIIHANSYSITEGDLSTKSFTKKRQKPFWEAGLEAMECHYGVCSAVMVRKDVYDTLGYFIESLSSDAEMWSRISSKYDVGFIEEPTVIYHVSKSSTGYESLTKRKIKDIKKDLDFLNESIASNYPTINSRNIYLKKYCENAPGRFYALTKANIKAHNYRNALEAIIFSVCSNTNPTPLLRLIYTDLKRLTLRLYSKQDKIK